MVKFGPVPGRTAPGVLLVLSTATISGVATFINFWAVQGANSDAFITLRNGLVVVMLLPLALLAWWEGHRRLRRRDWGRLVVIGFLGGGLPFLLFFRGLQLAGSAGAPTATFLYRTLFLMAAALAAVFLRERIGWRMAAAALLLLGGNALLLSLTAPLWTDGSLYVLAATVLWAGEYTLSKRTLRDLPSGLVASSRMGFGALFLMAYMVATGQVVALGSLGPALWQWAVVSAALLVAFVATWYEGLRHLDLSRATALLVLGFPITWALGALAGRGPVGLSQAAGFASVALAVPLILGLPTLRETWDYIVRGITRVGERMATP